jgi:hypothetical protein
MSNITFRNEVGPGVEILRISKEGIWANPDVPVDQAAHAVLAAVESNIRELVQRAVEAEREACAKVCDEYVVPVSIEGAHPDYLIGKQMAFQQAAQAIRERGER